MATDIIKFLPLAIYLIKVISATFSDVDIVEGSFLAWQVNNSDPSFFPANKSSSEVKLVFKFLRREIGSASPCKHVVSPTLCGSQTLIPLYFYYGSSKSSQPNFLRLMHAQFSCGPYSFDKPIINGYSQSTIVLKKDYFYKIRYFSCCWDPVMKSFGSSTLNQDIVIAFLTGKNSLLNSPVQLKYIPEVAIAQNEKETIKLPYYDVDNDFVACRWAETYSDGGGIFGARFGNLSESDCSLEIDASIYQPGKYPVAILLEDFQTPERKVKFHSVSIQFSIEIKASLFKESPKVNCTFISSNANRMPELVPFTTPQLPIPNYRPYTMTDACTSYSLLSSKDRSIAYSDWSRYRCDMPLFGWYRFTDAAGKQMLNSCPKESSSAVNSCGSQYKGWLKDQILPFQKEGIVNRSVCFSTADNCDCSYTREIKIVNCGLFYAYYLDGAPTCDARYCGKKDLGINVYCSSNYMQIHLDILQYNLTMYSSIALKSSNCKATYESDKISLGTKLDACGTTSRTVDSKILYENALILKGQPTGYISRQPDMYIKVTCAFSTNAFAQSKGHGLANEVNATEPGFGQFDLSLDMFISGKYTEKHKKFPVFVRKNDRLYFEARTTSSNQYLILIDRCYSTPVDDSNHATKYMFISNRCNVDDNVQFHKTSYDKQRFSAVASDLLANDTKAYVHCVVFLCHSSTNDSRCHSGCNGNNMKRTTRSVDNLIFRPSTVSNFYLVQLGAIEKEKDQSGGGILRCTSKIIILTLWIWYKAT